MHPSRLRNPNTNADKTFHSLASYLLYNENFAINMPNPINCLPNELPTTIQYNHQSLKKIIDNECVPIDEILSTSHVRRVIGEKENSLTSHFLGLQQYHASEMKNFKLIIQSYLSKSFQRNIAGLVIPDFLVHVSSLVGVDYNATI
jgi:hypothetical protein